MKKIISFSILVLFLCLVGCSDRRELAPGKLQVFSGGEQLAGCGEKCEFPLMVGIIAQGSGSKTVKGIRLKMLPDEKGGEVEPIEATTDEGGKAAFHVTLAKSFGDQYFTVTAPDYPSVEPLYVHFVAGVKVSNARQEGIAGERLAHPMGVTISDEEGKPLVDVPVFFSLKSGDKNARLSAHRVLTDANGTATVDFQTTDSYTGKYEILAEIGEGQHQTRGIVIEQLAISRMNVILGVLAGLGFFIFGMTMMSDGLQQAAGDRLKNLLQMFTGNRFNAMLAGVVVTALVQSSSACSVMVIGFVNASLLNLTQAIGILLGSSIGTTITAQIISFKLDFLSLPAIAIGVLWMLCAKKSQSKALGSTILGFGVLFFGMSLMSSQLKGIADFPTFIEFFNKFDCQPESGYGAPPFWAMIGAIVVGTVMTMIVQSSAATVGIAIALGESGLLNFYTAVPLILGDNIGTTITGLLAALNVNRTSREVAVANTVIKVLGVLVMIPFFYIPWDGVPCFMKLVDVMTAGDVFAVLPENLGRHFASAHTLFNILNVALFLPLMSFLVWLCRILVPESKADKEKDAPLVNLEERLLRTPSAALSQVMVALETMAEAAMKLTEDALAAVQSPDNCRSREDVDHDENRIDYAQQAIIDYLVALTRSPLNVSQSKTIPLFMHCVNDMERIGDRACNIFDLVPELYNKENRFSEEALKDLAEIGELLEYMTASLLRGLRHNDMEAIQKVLKLDGEAKYLTARFEQGHKERLKNQMCTVAKGLIYFEILENLERICSHLTNVADRAPQLLPYGMNFVQKQGG